MGSSNVRWRPWSRSSSAALANTASPTTTSSIAFTHPVRYEDLDDGFVMIIGPTRSAHLIELGFIDTDHGPVIVHAMTGRRKYLR